MSTSQTLETKLKQERLDDPEVVRQKSKVLAQLIEKSKHFICFTGAGISTSTGIPDYRSGTDTIIKTGPGAYEQPKGQQWKNIHAVRKTVQSAIPSKSHMALFALQQKGILKYIVSQNTDGLHLKSGVSLDHLVELHGNTNLEHCIKCERNYLRDFRTRTSEIAYEHKTGRKCDDPACNGDLEDQIIHFGEKIPQNKVVYAVSQGQQADLCLCLGSSLRVKPANQIPIFTLKNKGQIAIVNLQYTPIDELASIRIHSFCDDVMVNICDTLGIEIPQFHLKRRLHICRDPISKGILIYGSYLNNQRYSCITRVEFMDNRNHIYQNIDREPYTLVNELFLSGNDETSILEDDVEIRVHFQGHYSEPYYLLKVPRKAIHGLNGNEHLICDITFDFDKMDWIY